MLDADENASGPGPGHNSKGISAQRLKSFVERIERLTNDKENVASDIKEAYGESKSSGFDPKIIRKLIKLRKMDASDRQEEESLLQVYVDAVGF